MKVPIKWFTVLLLLLVTQNYAQDKFIQNLSKVPAFLNPSFYAFKDRTQIGVLGEITSQSIGTQSEHKYAFGSTQFEEYNFQLAFDFFSNSLKNGGYNYSTAASTFVYKLKLPNEWLLYPGITGAYSRYKFDFSNLTFQDQINIFSGEISSNTIDPVAAYNSVGYMDLGASVMMHNDENMIIGLSFKHINKPRLSSELSESGGNRVYLKMLVSGQFGYELDINKYGLAKIPKHSYLYFYNSVSLQGSTTRFDFYQDATLGNFSFGINQHFNFMEAFSFSEIGVSSSITFETFELGVNYRIPFGNQAKVYIPNALELFLTFNISRFKERRRSNYSRFY